MVSDVEPLLGAEPVHGAPLGDRHQPRPRNALDALAGPLLQGRDEGVLREFFNQHPTSCTMWVSGREIAVLAGRVYLRHDPPNGTRRAVSKTQHNDTHLLDFALAWAAYGGPENEAILVLYGISVLEWRSRWASPTRTSRRSNVVSP